MIYPPTKKSTKLGLLFRLDGDYRVPKHWGWIAYVCIAVAILSIIMVFVASRKKPIQSPIPPAHAETLMDMCSLDAVVCDGEAQPVPPPVEDRIRAVAEDNNFNSKILLSIAKCESTFDPTSDTNPPYLGLYQWNPAYIPDGAQCALDVECSTQQTINALKKGERWRWPNC